MKKHSRRQLATAVALAALTAGCAQNPQSAQPAANETTQSQEEPIKLRLGGYYRGDFAVGG